MNSMFVMRQPAKQEEHALEPDPLHDFEGLTYRGPGAILERLTAGATAA